MLSVMISSSQESNIIVSSSQTVSTSNSSNNEIAVVDEQGNTVGMLISNPTQYCPPRPQDVGLHLRYPVPCSKQANVTADWLKANFEENVLTSVPRSVMFEEYTNYCIPLKTKPFNQAVFGKVVRACFPNLATRRLGMRGQSRYHYAGLSVKLGSPYVNKFHTDCEKLNVFRVNNYHRKREVGAHVTIDGSYNEVNQITNDIGGKGNLNFISLVLPPYPTVDDMMIKEDLSQSLMANFLHFYRNYNGKLLGYIISLDFQNSNTHLRNFIHAIPEQCRSLFHDYSLCDVIALCDDIMFQEATAALLPNCLATLTTEFNGTVRKFAKTLPVWIYQAGGCEIDEKIVETRVNSAKKWCEFVQRVTALCHVTKETRKTLRHGAIVSQLLEALKNISLNYIVDQCEFAGNISSDKENGFATEREECQKHFEHFCKLLQGHSSVENYAAYLELLVEKHGCMKPRPRTPDDVINFDDATTYGTRQFVMKWPIYASKMLTEITLNSSESFGTFHLIMLLFGDYINHVILLRKEQDDRLKKIAKVVKRDSPYWRHWLPEFPTSDKTSVYMGKKTQGTQPYPIVTPGTSYRNTQFVINQQIQYNKPTIIQNKVQNQFNYHFQDVLVDECFQPACHDRPAVAVEPAFSSKVSSFYLLPGQINKPQSAILVKK